MEAYSLLSGMGEIASFENMEDISHFFAMALQCLYIVALSFSDNPVCDANYVAEKILRRIIWRRGLQMAGAEGTGEVKEHDMDRGVGLSKEE